ncbi:MAG: 1,4-dihydroxy-2-naphthoate octaprenyltransferase [Paludibacteraceae bacterium]|nr:1,4-dihydroxy-2-naphthoate octaprenyltransferase [Paludibacteraceae bacterium]
MEEVKQNSVKAWCLAARPKTLAAAVAPVMVGCALAYYYEKFQLVPALACLLFAIAMQIAANLINDLYDFLKGSDGEGRLGPLRATAQGWITPNAMKKGILSVVAFGCLCGSVLMLYVGWQLVFVGLFCVLFAYLYTSGPFPLAYNGLGDVAVVAFFGLVAVGFTAYVQILSWPNTLTLAGVATGCAVNVLLVLNNYRDVENDAKSGKRTLVVLLGKKFGLYLYLASGLTAVLLSAVLCLLIEANLFGWLMLLPYSALHFLTWLKIRKIEQPIQLNGLIGETSRNMLVFALSLLLILDIGCVKYFYVGEHVFNEFFCKFAT